MGFFAQGQRAALIPRLLYIVHTASRYLATRGDSNPLMLHSSHCSKNNLNLRIQTIYARHGWSRSNSLCLIYVPDIHTNICKASQTYEFCIVLLYWTVCCSDLEAQIIFGTVRLRGSTCVDHTVITTILILHITVGIGMISSAVTSTYNLWYNMTGGFV